jgi:hypothetical protein
VASTVLQLVAVRLPTELIGRLDAYTQAHNEKRVARGRHAGAPPLRISRADAIRYFLDRAVADAERER